MLQENLNTDALELAKMDVFSLHSETEVRYGCGKCYGIAKHYTLYATLEEAKAHAKIQHVQFVGEAAGKKLV